MPRRPKPKVCAIPGCPEFSEPGRSYCRPHDLERKRVQPRGSMRRAGYDAHWERTRRDFLEAVGKVCMDCGASDVTIDVHHIDNLGPKGPRGHDWSNLLALCKPCHSRRTRLEANVR